MDKTLINIISLLITGSGFFAALTKYYSPNVTHTFWDFNPYLIKQKKVDNITTWLFVMYLLSGVILQIYTEIIGDLPTRLYSLQYYVEFSLGIFFIVVVLLYYITTIGRVLAMKRLRPIFIEKYKENFNDAKFIVENNGWTKKQLNHKKQFNKDEKHLAQNFRNATESLELIEDLLDYDTNDLPLEQKIKMLSPLFNQ